MPVSEYSDHMPLFFSFQTQMQMYFTTEDQTKAAKEDKIFWDQTKETIFIQRLFEFQSDLLSIENKQLSINHEINSFCKFLAEPSLHVLAKYQRHQMLQLVCKKIRSPWFSEDCREAQKWQEQEICRTKYNTTKSKAKKQLTKVRNLMILRKKNEKVLEEDKIPTQSQITISR